MPTVTIEDKKYDMDTLSKEAQAQVKNVTYCDTRLQELSAEMALVRTARSSYLQALMQAIPKDG